MWRCIAASKQYALIYLGTGSVGGVAFAPALPAEAIFEVAYFPDGDAAKSAYDRWRKEYAVSEIDVSGVTWILSAAWWVGQLAAMTIEGGYYAGQNCPCRFRDGWSPPVPICP